MRRRDVPPEDRVPPPHLAAFNPADWPDPPEHWPAEFGRFSYQRLAWHRARRAWREASS